MLERMSQLAGLKGINAFVWLYSISFICAGTLHAAVKPEIRSRQTRSSDTFFNASQLRSSLNVPLNVTPKLISIPKRQVKARIEKTTTDNRIEPVQLTVSNDDEKILALVEKIAQPQSKLVVANYLKQNFPTSESIPGTSLRLVNLNQSIIDQLKPDAFEALFTKKHNVVSISGSLLQNDPTVREDLLKQVGPFLDKSELSSLRSKIKAGDSIRIDKELLPKFARKRVGRHTIYKGPNCFHAALAFQSDALASSSLVNVRQEPGYHRNMVNYDELWRILQLAFYEIDPTKSPMQYGDMIVFFDIADKKPGPIDFKTLRHAATYLVGGYVFAKGSKSANSPYIVGTLGDEWDTWTRYTKKLGVKVFRRNLKHVTKGPLVDPLDWVY